MPEIRARVEVKWLLVDFVKETTQNQTDQEVN